jgi:hypothetical protein
MRVICQRDRYRYIRLPLRFINKQFKIDHNTNFCVDTGAPTSLVSYQQAVEWKIPFNQLQKTPGIYRVGGLEGPGYYLDDNIILLRDFRGKLHAYSVPRIIVFGSDPKDLGKALPVPALLGDDILRQFTLLIESEQHGGEVLITDEKVSVNAPSTLSH